MSHLSPNNPTNVCIMKISIVMTYFDRIKQLKNSLYSISLSKYDDFNVIIIDDVSSEEINIDSYNFEIQIYRLKYKISTNPGPVYNLGFQKAIESGAEIIIIQNAECYHIGDIVSHAASINEGRYYSYHCYSLSKGQKIGAETKDILPFNSGDEGWYNHETIRPVMFHFCSAIRVTDLKKLNGFDERFYDGICYEDDYFVHQIKNLNLDVKFISDPFVYHQWHSIGVRYDQLVIKNSELWDSLKNNKDYRAKHLITDDL